MKVSDEMFRLLYAKAKTEGRKLEHLTDELLHKALWNEPEFIFKGRMCRVDPDLFGNFEPKPGEIEEWASK